LKKQKKKNGVTYIKKEYIKAKYGNDISKIILTAYDWFVKEMKKKVDRP